MMDEIYMTLYLSWIMTQAFPFQALVIFVAGVLTVLISQWIGLNIHKYISKKTTEKKE